jgi:hypothetical protein
MHGCVSLNEIVQISGFLIPKWEVFEKRIDFVVPLYPPKLG